MQSLVLEQSVWSTVSLLQKTCVSVVKVDIEILFLWNWNSMMSHIVNRTYVSKSNLSDLELANYVLTLGETSDFILNYSYNCMESVWIRLGCKYIGQNPM